MDPREHRGSGMGSGVIVSPDGYVLTNNHVVDGGGELTVTLPDKREFKGKVVGTDPKTDLAVVKIEGSNLPHTGWGDSSKLQVGEYVLAIGNPFGLNSTVTLGIVSALGRGRMGITQYEDFIQTDAAINPGNSGGALVNTNGELVGINTAIISQSGGYQGVGFAVPASMAKPVFDSLVKSGKVVRGFLGIGIQDLNQDLAKSFGLKEAKGALVSNVAEESPADKAGIKQGDVIVRYQQTPIDDAAALQRAVTGSPIGSKAVVKVIRNGHEQELTATVGEQTETKQVARTESGVESALAGVEVQNLNQQMARELGLQGTVHGVVVVNVESGSQADRVGLAQGDVIKEINRHPVTSVKDYEQIVSALKKDQDALLLISRRGSSLFITVTA
jgi:serine protease Do